MRPPTYCTQSSQAHGALEEPALIPCMRNIIGYFLKGGQSGSSSPARGHSHPDHRGLRDPHPRRATVKRRSLQAGADLCLLGISLPLIRVDMCHGILLVYL